MKDNKRYRKLIAKTVDTQALSLWRKDYLNGLTASQWVEWGKALRERQVICRAKADDNGY